MIEIIKSVVSSKPTAMRGNAISSGERKIILNVFKHFKTENSSSIKNAVITLAFKVPWIVKHGVKSPSKIRPKGWFTRSDFRIRFLL